MPRLSVAIPAYNYGRYLPCAMRSVLDQGHGDLELVIVDDCSTDDTPQRVTPFLSDPRVRYLRNERNLGAVRNINKAIGETRGDFILLLGADDFILPGSLSALLAALEAHPEAGFAYGNYVFADDNDRILDIVRHPGHIPAALPPWRDDFPNLLRFDDYINLGTALFRRSVIEQYGFFDPLLSIDDLPGRFFRATDWDLCLRLALAGVRSTFVYSPLSAFRIHATQASVGGDFDREGIATREFAVLLERYLRPENAARLAGHERAIFQLLHGKQAALAEQADPAAIGDRATLDRRLADAEDFLRRLSAEPFAEACATPPTLSVILVVNDNPQDFLPTLADLGVQDHDGLQLLVINRGRMDFSHLVRPWRWLHLPGMSLPAARDYGVQLTDGTGLCFIEAGSRCAPGYLAAMATALGQAGTQVVQAIPEASATAPAQDNASWHAALAALLPASHPWRAGPPALSSFVLRRPVYHRLGGFEKSLGLLDDLDFLLRLHHQAPIQPVPGAIQPRSMLAGMLRAAQESGQPDLIARSLQAIAERQPGA